VSVSQVAFLTSELQTQSSQTKGRREGGKEKEKETKQAQQRNVPFEPLPQRQQRRVHRVIKLHLLIVTLLQEVLGVDVVLANGRGLPPEVGPGRVHLGREGGKEGGREGKVSHLHLLIVPHF